MKKPTALVAALTFTISTFLSAPALYANADKFPPTPAWIQQRLDQGQRCPQFEDDFLAAGLPPKIMSYVAYRESRCRVGAINARFDSKGNVVWTLNKNGTFDSGLLQVNSGWKSVTAKVCRTKFGDLKVLLRLDCNLKVAKYLYDNGGLRHWSIKA
jgi:hypothetical protein